jgi:hypothetical protein
MVNLCKFSTNVCVKCGFKIDENAPFYEISKCIIDGSGTLFLYNPEYGDGEDGSEVRYHYFVVDEKENMYEQARSRCVRAQLCFCEKCFIRYIGDFIAIAKNES